MRYSYRAYSGDGRLSVGDIESTGKSQAIRLLAQQGLSVFELGNAAVESARGVAVGPTERKTLFVSQRPDLGRLYADLALLTGAGLTVTQALRALRDTERPGAQRSAIANILDKISGGASTSSSFATIPSVQQDTLGIIASGENTGRMDEVFSALALQAREQARLRQELLNALGYPAFLLALMVLAVLVLTFGLVPSIAPIFVDSGQPAPMIVRWLTGLREGLTSGLGRAILVFILAGSLLFLLPNIRNKLSPKLFPLVLRFPVFGSILRKSTSSRYLSGLALQLANGTPMAKALQLSAACTNSEAFKSRLLMVKEAVSTGEALASALRSTGFFDERIVSLIAVGDEASRLPVVTKRAADILETEVINTIKRGTALLTPLMTILMGALIGGLVVSVMTALLSINEIAIQ
jgi:general secretion pathway protein F